MGEPEAAGFGILLPRIARSLLAQSSPLFQWPRTNRDVADGRLGHANDYGLAKFAAWFFSLLYVRRNVSRVSGRQLEPSGSGGVRPVSSGNHRGAGVPLALFALRRELSVSHRRLCGREPSP